MHYIIMDLEWNNVYAPRVRGFINEVIEIGAVMLDDGFNCVSEFSSFIKSKVGKRLRSNVKRLTNITNDDIRNADPFTVVMDKFKDWIGDEENVILTWGDGDIRVLIENYRYINGQKTLPFMTNYMDAQNYFQIRNGISKSKQIGLFNAAELVGIDPETFAHHRALDDSLVTAECIKKVYERESFAERIAPCDEAFYQKLQYRPHAIGNINHPLVDKSLLNYTCDECGVECERLTEWRYSNQYFRASYHCPQCGKNVRVNVRFKKYFDRLETKKTVSVINTEKTAKAESQS